MLPVGTPIHRHVANGTDFSARAPNPSLRQMPAYRTYRAAVRYLASHQVSDIGPMAARW